MESHQIIRKQNKTLQTKPQIQNNIQQENVERTAEKMANQEVHYYRLV